MPMTLHCDYIALCLHAATGAGMSLRIMVTIAHDGLQQLSMVSRIAGVHLALLHTINCCECNATGLAFPPRAMNDSKYCLLSASKHKWPW